MTDPIDRVDAARGLERKNERGRFSRGTGPKRHHEEEENDSVEISSEARERASQGKTGKKT